MTLPSTVQSLEWDKDGFSIVRGDGTYSLGLGVLRMLENDTERMRLSRSGMETQTQHVTSVVFAQKGTQGELDEYSSR